MLEVGLSGTPRDVAAGDTDLKGQRSEVVATGEIDPKGQKMEVVSAGEKQDVGDRCGRPSTTFIHDSALQLPISVWQLV